MRSEVYKEQKKTQLKITFELHGLDKTLKVCIY